MLKRFAIMLFCLMMVFIATFGFVVGVVAVPTIYSYAETTNNFEPIRDQSDAVYAFQAYCKSRDLTIEGSITDAVTSYTTDAYNFACNKIGVNPTELQAQIQAEYDQAGKPIKFLFSSVGIDVFNRIFSQFLQDNELEIGDNADQLDNTVFSGELFTDIDGNSCLVWIISNNGNDSANATVQARGSYYKFTTQSIISKVNQVGNNRNGYYAETLNLTTDKTIDYYYIKYSYNSNWGGYYDIHASAGSQDSSVYGYVKYNIASQNKNILGYPIIYHTYANENRYYIGMMQHNFINDVDYNTKFNNAYFTKSSAGDKLQNTIVFLSTNNTVINNNNYEGDTIINNEGDVIVDEPDPIPPGGTDPGWDIGGGGGTANDGNGNTWNIQFPDFELPDLNIDWSINGLGEKFPFSIPFDLVALVTVLNAEPQAPRFEGTVNFGFTTWDYDINLQQFDTVAQACRIAELLLLVVGLILVTRSIIKG